MTSWVDIVKRNNSNIILDGDNYDDNIISQECFVVEGSILKTESVIDNNIPEAKQVIDSNVSYRKGTYAEIVSSKVQKAYKKEEIHSALPLKYKIPDEPKTITQRQALTGLQKQGAYRVI